MDRVYLLKLSNGEEIFGQIPPDGQSIPGQVTILDPMTAEARNLADGSSAMVINRYLPLVKTNSIHLRQDSIIVMNEVSEALREYYELSVAYARRSDQALNENIRTASAYMRKVLTDREDVVKAAKSLDESDDEDERERARERLYKHVLNSVKNTKGSFH